MEIRSLGRGNLFVREKDPSSGQIVQSASVQYDFASDTITVINLDTSQVALREGAAIVLVLGALAVVGMTLAFGAYVFCLGNHQTIPPPHFGHYSSLTALQKT